MKMVKKVLMGLAVAAIALALTGCGKQLGDSSVKISGSTGKASIDHTNETDSTQRAMKIYLTKHKSTNCAFVIENQTSSSYDGQLGYVFNMDTNSDGTYNFIAVGFRNNKGTTDTYVSYFLNIKEDDFSKTNFGVDGDVNDDYEIYGSSRSATKTLSAFTPPNVKVKGVPSEVEIAALPVTLTDFSINSAQQLIGAIDIKANTDGSYTVGFFNEAQLKIEKTESTGKINKITIKEGQTAKKTVSISNTITGYTKETEAKLGVYAAIYKAGNLTGSWFASDLEGNPIPAEFED